MRRSFIHIVFPIVLHIFFNLQYTHIIALFLDFVSLPLDNKPIITFLYFALQALFCVKKKKKETKMTFYSTCCCNEIKKETHRCKSKSKFKIKWKEDACCEDFDLDLDRNFKPVYGEWIRTFTFDSKTNPSLPIVQPGGFLVFPLETVKPKNIQYIDQDNQTGILVPPGTYRISVLLNPSEGANLSLLVNGQLPLSRSIPPFTYTKQIMSPFTNIMHFTYYIDIAKSQSINLISLQNSGTSLLTLNNIPNTTLPNSTSLTSTTSVITQVEIIRIS